LTRPAIRRAGSGPQDRPGETGFLSIGSSPIKKKGEAALDVYERIERVETRKSPSDPAPAAIKISRVIPSGTGMVRIPLGGRCKPSDSAAYRAELEGLARSPDGARQ